MFEQGYCINIYYRVYNNFRLQDSLDLFGAAYKKMAEKNQGAGAEEAQQAEEPKQDKQDKQDKN